MRIVIKAQAKSEIGDLLDQKNASERTLFPGLPGTQRVVEALLWERLVVCTAQRS